MEREDGGVDDVDEREVDQLEVGWREMGTDTCRAMWRQTDRVL